MNMRTRVKICGITRASDVFCAVSAGADALGLVFYSPSPRHVDLKTAAEIAAQIPAFVSIVGLFVDASPERVRGVLDRIPLQILQFHGNESASYCGQFGIPYIKALRVGGEKEKRTVRAGALEDEQLRSAIDSHAQACAILFDTCMPGTPGGTGEVFDWGLVPEVDQQVILAGGLHPENVSRAIRELKPYAVDVSSGVESAPGVKDADRIRAFLTRVRQADAALCA